MKFKFILLVIVIVSVNSTFSQTKELYVEYDFYFKDNFPENRQIELRVNHKESLSTTIRTIMVRDYDSKTGETSEATPRTNYRYIYKNNIAKTLQYSEFTPVPDGIIFVKETLDQFDWKLTGNKKTILNYTCQEATTNYRGRDYAAYFTTQIPFKAAPWKFHGLPGVMLEIKTIDNRVKIVAKALKIQTIKEVITNPFAEKQEFIPSWIDFKELYKKRLFRSRNRSISKLSSIPMSSEDRARIGIAVDLKIEIIVPENGLSINEQREVRKLKN